MAVQTAPTPAAVHGHAVARKARAILRSEGFTVLTVNQLSRSTGVSTWVFPNDIHNGTAAVLILSGDGTARGEITRAKVALRDAGLTVRWDSLGGALEVY